MAKGSTSLLSQPIRIGTKRASNRIVYQSMESNDADGRGRPSERTLARYRRLAEGGPGVLFVEAMSISETSRGRTNELRIRPETAESLAQLVAVIREANPEPLVLFQISHDGRNSGSFSRRVGLYPSGDPPVEVISTEEIEPIGDEVVRAAVIAAEAGADGIDFKHCHGYLFCEMLRPANRREDRYGGSFENRTRFFAETVEKIKNEVADRSFILGCRVSAYEPFSGGIGTAGPESDREDLTEPIAFARLMEKAGMHYINVSAGGPLSVPGKADGDAVLRHFRLARTIKAAVGLPVMGATYTFFRDGDHKLEGPGLEGQPFRSVAERNISEGWVDLVGVGRQSFADPLFAKKVLSGSSEIDYCTLCNGCRKLLARQQQAGCAVYDEHYRSLLVAGN